MTLRPLISFFLHFVLDWERLGPLWRTASRSSEPIDVVATPFFASRRPDIVAATGARVLFGSLLRVGVAWLRPPYILVTAAESSAPAHRYAHRLTRMANLQGVRTVSVQHGFECVGLTYCDSVLGPETSVAAQTILMWASLELIHPELVSKVAGRCEPIGFISLPVSPSDISHLGRKLMGLSPPRVLIAENLHWHRYDETYRRAFIADLAATANRHSNWHFIVKPHPAGQFGKTLRQSGVPSNVHFQSDFHIEPELPIGTWLNCVDAVITTPSTLAVDAAVQKKPVAVARYGLAGSWPYSPLPTLDSAEDWTAFLQRVFEGNSLILSNVDTFVRTRLNGVAEPHQVLEHILQLAGANRCGSKSTIR